MSKVRITIDIDVVADISRYYHATRHSPEEPQSIEDVALSINGIDFNQELYDLFWDQFGNFIESQIWQEVEEEAQERAIDHAEHMQDLKENR